MTHQVTLKKRIATAIAALAIGFGGAAVAATPAQAHETCSSLSVCLHTGATYSGSEGSWYVGSTSYGSFCVSLYGSTLNNNVESIYGNYVGAGRRIYYYDGNNCIGSAVFTSTGGKYATLPTSARNTITSFYVTNG